MPLTRLQKQDYPLLAASMTDSSWTVACFCAQWCGACRNWFEPFKTLSEKYPDLNFIWIDIEDHADLLDTLEIDNFPCLLIQYGDIVNFFGAIHPDIKVAERLLLNHQSSRLEEMKGWVLASKDRIQWQEEANLRKLFRQAVQSA